MYVLNFSSEYLSVFLSCREVVVDDGDDGNVLLFNLIHRYSSEYLSPMNFVPLRFCVRVCVRVCVFFLAVVNVFFSYSFFSHPTPSLLSWHFNV